MWFLLLLYSITLRVLFWSHTTDCCELDTCVSEAVPQLPYMSCADAVLQPKVPTTSVPDSQHPPAKTQTAALEPLQQLIQQMGGLQQQQLPASTAHQSLLHSQPLPVPNAAVSKSDDEASPIQMFIRQLGTKASKPQVCSQPKLIDFGLVSWDSLPGRKGYVSWPPHTAQFSIQLVLERIYTSVA